MCVLLSLQLGCVSPSSYLLFNSGINSPKRCSSSLFHRIHTSLLSLVKYIYVCVCVWSAFFRREKITTTTRKSHPQRWTCFVSFQGDLLPNKVGSRFIANPPWGEERWNGEFGEIMTLGQHRSSLVFNSCGFVVCVFSSPTHVFQSEAPQRWLY